MRQTAFSLSAFILISVAAWAVSYHLILSELSSKTDRILHARMQETVRALSQNDPLPKLALGQTMELSSTKQKDGYFEFEVEEDEGDDYRCLSQTTQFGTIILGENIEERDELTDILFRSLFATLVLSASLTGVASGWQARRSQRRIETIKTGLKAIGSGALDHQIHLAGNDDLNVITDRINATTKQLAQSTLQLKNQSSSIAHDLRTPLARLRANLEQDLTNLKEFNRPVSLESLQASISQVDNITQIFDVMLDLSHLETKEIQKQFSEVSLSKLVEEVVEIYDPVVAESGQSLRAEIRETRQISGDRKLLIQLFGNIIQNALKYAPFGDEILIRTSRYEVEIIDQGDGIPESEQDKVLQPFYRVEYSRQSEGTGLGLAIVNAICEAHGAELSLNNLKTVNGFCVRIKFPKLTKL